MSTYIKLPESGDCEWRTGFPEQPGWYPASFKFPPDPGVLRYYFGDGKWSSGFEHTTDASWFDLFGEVTPMEEQRDDIMWAAAWWPAVEQESRDAASD